MVDRVHIESFSSKQFQRLYRNPGVPVIVQGLLGDEPTWDLNYLDSMLGDRIFPVRRYGRDRYQQDKRQWTSSGSGVDVCTMPFSDYASCLKSGHAAQQDLYLARCSLRDTPLEHHTTLHSAEAWFGMTLPATYFNLWVGPGGRTSCLHYDPMDGILMQLHGAKRILLFPPSQTYNLYPIPIYKQLRYGLKLRPVYSQVYPAKPDFQVFPRYEKAIPHASECELQAGEVLFLPAGWWHEITSIGDGGVCSINRFWNVFPVSRALSSWNKWRAHLGSVLASPHIAGQFVSAVRHANASLELRKLFQQL